MIFGRVKAGGDTVARLAGESRRRGRQALIERPRVDGVEAEAPTHDDEAPERIGVGAPHELTLQFPLAAPPANGEVAVEVGRPVDARPADDIGAKFDRRVAIDE